MWQRLSPYTCLLVSYCGHFLQVAQIPGVPSIRKAELADYYGMILRWKEAGLKANNWWEMFQQSYVPTPAGMGSIDFVWWGTQLTVWDYKWQEIYDSTACSPQFTRRGADWSPWMCAGWSLGGGQNVGSRARELPLACAKKRACQWEKRCVPRWRMHVNSSSCCWYRETHWFSSSSCLKSTGTRRTQERAVPTITSESMERWIWL